MTTNTFAYNGFGARVSKTDSAGTTTYLRSGTSVVAPVVADSGATYTPGVSERRGTASRFYHGDIKNFVEQTDSSGQIVSSRQYDAFGNEMSSQGSWQGPFQYGGAFGYHTDTDYGLKHLGARYYDSTTGRFLSRDPIKDGRDWYGYCDNNPVRCADPSGLLLIVVVLQDLVAEAEPPRPPGASVRVNTVRLRTVIAYHTKEEALDWWIRNVRAGGPWDYHTRFGDAYDAFGNYNYGYTGAFLGYSLPVLQRAAGYYSQKRSRKSTWESLTKALGPPPYGDDSFDDQYWIKRGYEQFQKEADLYYPDGNLFSSEGGMR